MTKHRFTTTLARLTLAASVVAIAGCAKRGPSPSQTPPSGGPLTATLPAPAKVPTLETPAAGSPPSPQAQAATPTAVHSSDPALEAEDIDQQLSALQRAVEGMDPLSDIPSPVP